LKSVHVTPAKSKSILNEATLTQDIANENKVAK
jgi:hypothetical protein